MIANANLRNTSVRDAQGAAQRQSGVRSTEDRSEAEPGVARRPAGGIERRALRVVEFTSRYDRDLCAARPGATPK